jgi:hypothetical protein
MATSKLQKAIERGLRPGGNLWKELSKLCDKAVQTAADARAVCAALERVRPSFGILLDDSKFCALVVLFQRVGSVEAFAVLRSEGLPRLIAIFDETLRRVPVGESADELLFLLKVLAMYRSKEGVERIVHAAHMPLDPEGWFWLIIFNVFDAEHPHHMWLCDQLRDPLPEGFIAMAYLDFANRLAREGDLGLHPFNSPAGKTRLESWLIDPDTEYFGFAHIAAASLSFLSNPGRDQLLALAMDHPLAEVQMEAAWATVRLGSASGLKLLERFCLDVNHSKTAQAYLEELGREDVIPETALNPDFQAMAEIAHWLAHPVELGQAPESVTLYDTRELFWPPTNDRRRLWLIQYRYKSDEPGKPDDVGIGIVGSITFALPDAMTADQPPEDIYALYCCWELRMNRDPRAPKKCSVEVGRKILESYQ